MGIKKGNIIKEYRYGKVMVDRKQLEKHPEEIQRILSFILIVNVTHDYDKMVYSGFSKHFHPSTPNVATTTYDCGIKNNIVYVNGKACD